MTTQSTAASFPRERDVSIDVLKGIGIVVIVMGHLDASGIGGAFVTYLYSFNVALFFIVAGYMWRPKPGIGFWQIAVQKFRQIYVPYTVLFVISLLYGHLIVRFVFGEYVIPFELWPTVKSFILASDWLNHVPTFNFALWFLPIFFLASIVFQLFQMIRPLGIYLPVLALLLFASIPLQEAIPGRPILAINVLPVAVGFMGCGYLLKRWVNVERVPLVGLIVMFAFTLTITYWFPGNVAAIGTLWYFPSALVSFLLYLRLARDLRSSRFLAYVGENSLIIFGIHGLVANTYTHTRIPELLAPWTGLLPYLINVAYVLLASVITVRLYRFSKTSVVNRRNRPLAT
jgi:fucose 4-O-acetylase-like acetyltransferase